MNFQISAISPRTVLGELNRTLVKLSFAILTFLLGFILGKIVERVVYKVLKEIELNNLIKNSTGLRLNADHIISHILSYTIYFLSLVAALEQIGLANTILYLLSAAAIAIILISFFLAIRDFIPNVMAGFYLYTKENLKDGKFVEIDDIKGEYFNKNRFTSSENPD